MSKYKIVAIIGKSGAGKDTLLKLLYKFHEDMFHPIVSTTTRPIRQGEEEAKDYFFISPEEFQIRAKNHDFLEISYFNGWSYGTELSSLSTDKINIGVFNPQGIKSLKMMSDLVDLYIINVFTSDKNRLLRQLYREENPNVEEIIRRYNTDNEDFKELKDINLYIDNTSSDDLIDSKKFILQNVVNYYS